VLFITYRWENTFYRYKNFYGEYQVYYKIPEYFSNLGAPLVPRKKYQLPRLFIKDCLSVDKLQQI
jgi:hypothetical protein